MAALRAGADLDQALGSRRREPVPRACQTCGAQFMARSPLARFCSRRCRPSERHSRSRGKTAERGYGGKHQSRRRALLASAYGKPCPLCGRIMLASQRLHLDHTVPVSLGGDQGDRITHGWCNEQRGNGRRRRRRVQAGAAPATIRVWSRKWY